LLERFCWANRMLASRTESSSVSILGEPTWRKVFQSAVSTIAPRKPLVRVRSIVGEPEVIHVANYGNDSCSVSNAVQFADLEFQAEMCNECRRLFSTVDVQSPRKLRRKRVQRANGRDTFGNQTRETHSHAQRFSMGSDSFSQHLKQRRRQFDVAFLTGKQLTVRVYPVEEIVQRGTTSGISGFSSQGLLLDRLGFLGLSHEPTVQRRP
jgi:hypothetical protein